MSMQRSTSKARKSAAGNEAAIFAERDVLWPDSLRSDSPGAGMMEQTVDLESSVCTQNLDPLTAIQIEDMANLDEDIVHDMLLSHLQQQQRNAQNTVIAMNLFLAQRYFHMGLADYKEETDTLTYRPMHNCHLQPPTPTASPTHDTLASSSSSDATEPTLRPPSPPTATAGGLPHKLVLLRSLYEKYGIEMPKKGKAVQQRCVCCNKPTSWACSVCSEGAFQLVPVHPARTRGGGCSGKGGQQHDCERVHCCNPSFRKSAQVKAMRAKRARDDDDNETEDEGW